MSSFKNINPKVSFVINYTDIPFLINAFKDKNLNTMEKNSIKELDTIGYFEKILKNTKSELVEVELNVEIELSILINKIKSSTFLKDATIFIKSGKYFEMMPYTSSATLNLTELIELILNLPNEYEKQIVAKKFKKFDN